MFTCLLQLNNSTVEHSNKEMLQAERTHFERASISAEAHLYSLHLVLPPLDKPQQQQHTHTHTLTQRNTATKCHIQLLV